MRGRLRARAKGKGDQTTVWLDELHARGQKWLRLRTLAGELLALKISTHVPNIPETSIASLLRNCLAETVLPEAFTTVGSSVPWSGVTQEEQPRRSRG